jgi:hypothetical protein
MMLMVSPSSRKDRERRQDGERDGNADDDGAAPASQEQQDHQAGQDGGDATASLSTPLMAARTKMDWSKSSGDLQFAGGSVERMRGRMLP